MPAFYNTKWANLHRKVLCNVILFLGQKVTFLHAQRLDWHLAITLQESKENKAE